MIQVMRSSKSDKMSGEFAAQTFSDTLRRFHERLFTFSWEEQFPGLVFIRDYEELPVRALFDIDIVSPPAVWTNLDTVFGSLAKELGLVMISHRSGLLFPILIFDPVIPANQQERTWVYFEVREHIVVTPTLTLTGPDLLVDCASGIPVPNDSWRFFLTLIQSLRKNDLENRRSDLVNLAKREPGVFKKTAELLGVKQGYVEECLNSAVPAYAIRKRLGIVAKPSKMLLPPSWKTSLKYYIEERLFFVHLSKPFLYTLHGADGVGKTTAREILQKIFDGYPMSFVTFHHITVWKHADRNGGDHTVVRNVEQTKNQILSKPLWRRGLSLFYRSLPERVRNIWVLSSGYVKYCTNLDAMIIRHVRKDSIMLADRYLHDMWVKNQLVKKGPDILHHLHARALRKPRLAILLVDKPERVIERKQELSVEEIAFYQIELENTLKKTGVRYVRIAVNGRPVQVVAREIAATLLNDIGPATLNLIRAHVQKMTASASS